MTNDNMEKKNELPYGADIKIMNDLVDIVGRNGTIEIGRLYELIQTKSKPVKSYSKKMAEFFGLILSEGQTIKLSNMGSLYRACRNDDEKKLFLAQNLPEKYLTILTWINNSQDGTMTLTELRQAMINSWGDKKNQNYFLWICNNFANFASWIGVINYTKGQNVKYIITETGKASLEVAPMRKTVDTLSGANVVKIVGKVTQKVDQLSLEGNFPIRIISRGANPLELDIQYDEDWDVVESYIKSLKKRWNKNKDEE